MDPDCNSGRLGQSDDKKNCLIFIATKARTKGENSIQGVGRGGGGTQGCSGDFLGFEIFDSGFFFGRN